MIIFDVCLVRLLCKDYHDYSGPIKALTWFNEDCTLPKAKQIQVLTCTLERGTRFTKPKVLVP